MQGGVLTAEDEDEAGRGGREVGRHDDGGGAEGVERGARAEYGGGHRSLEGVKEGEGVHDDSHSPHVVICRSTPDLGPRAEVAAPPGVPTPSAQASQCQASRIRAQRFGFSCASPCVFWAADARGVPARFWAAAQRNPAGWHGRDGIQHT